MQTRKINSLVWFGLVLMVVKTILSFSAIIPWPDIADNIVIAVASSCFLVVILGHKYPLRILIGFAFIVGIALYGAVITKNSIILSAVLICIAAYKENFNEIVKVIFFASRFCFIIHTVLALVMHFVFGTEIMQIIRGETRYAFGFGHPNTFSCYFFNLILMWIWLNFYKIQKSRAYLVVITLATLIVFSFTRTKTMLGTSLIVYLLCFLCRGINKERKWLSIFAQLVTPACGILILALTVIYANAAVHGESNSFALILRTLLSGRIMLGAYAFSHWGVTLFGQNLYKHSVNYDPVWGLNGHTFDDVYTYLAMNMGIVWLFVVVILFYLLAKKRNDKVNIFIIAWAVYGVCEVHVLNAFMFFPILMIMLLFERQAKIKRISNKLELLNV